MSELTIPIRIDIPGVGSIESADLYLKSEADKVIADLEESHKKEVGQLLIEVAELKEQVHDYALGLYVIQAKAEKESRHHKYKRCLSMATEWRNYAAFCGMQSSCHNHRGFGKTAEKWTWKECHAWKCMKRYKELAEKFKTTNSNAQ